MKKLLFLLPILMLCGCDGDNGINYEDEKNTSVTVTDISVSTSEMVVGSENGSCSVYVRLTTEGYSYYNEPEWKLTGGASWCTPSKTSGRGEDNIEFTVSENPDSDDRSATFTITCQNLQSNFMVIQRGQGKNPVTGTSSTMNVESCGGEVVIEVNANVDYIYEIADDCKDWITAADDTRVMETTKINLNIAPNPESKERQGVITITSGETSEKVTIIQSGITLLVVSSKIEVEGIGGEAIIEIRSDVDYTYNIDSKCKNWITAAKTRAIEDSKIVLNVAPNPESKERQGAVTVSSGNISEKVTIIQSGITLIVVSSKIEIDGAGGEAIIEIKSDVDYTYDIDSKCKDWIMPADTRAVETTQIKLNVAPNPELKERQGTVIVSNGNISEKVVIIQSAGKPYIEVKQTEYDVSKDGETIEVEVNSNCDFNITIPNCDWIKAVQNKTAPTNLKYFEISKNPNLELRTAEIFFEGKEYDVSAKVSVSQQPATSMDISVNVPQVGTLASILSQYKMDEVDAVTLKISGILNDVDFITIRNISNLRYLDISEVNITELPGRAFISSTIEEVILPKHLVAIGESMFNKAKIKNIIIPKNVSIIGSNAFRGCINMTNIIFEQNSQLRTISESAFRECTALTFIDIPANVEIIESEAFSKCESLSNVTFEKSSQLKTIAGGFSGEIYYGAFAYCSTLATIEIPASVETIEPTAFGGCISLVSVTFEKGSQLKAIDGAYPNSSYEYYNDRYYGVFVNCTSLTSIEIPNSVEVIGPSAFRGCSSLRTVIFEKGSKLKTIKGGYYYNSSSGGHYYYGAFYACPIKSIEIPASVETIEPTVFKNSGLQTITFERGSKLKTIRGGYTKETNSSYGTFSGCSSLTSIEIPASVETIEATAFKGCTGLKSLTFEKGSKLKTIIGGCFSKIVVGPVFYYYGAFANCSSLSHIEFPANLEKIGATAFMGCSLLNTISFEQGSQLKTIGGDYYYYSRYGSYNETYYAGAFCELSNLTTVDMSECTQLQSLGKSIFAKDSKLQIFKIGTKTPPKMDSYIFQNALTSYSILKVPEESIEAYKGKYPWNLFSSITALDE